MTAIETVLTKKEYQIIPLPETHDFSDMSISKGNGDAVGFLHHETGRMVGYAWYDICDGDMKLDLIYVIEKEEGHGTRIVHYLFDELKLESIFGSVMLNYDLCAWSFWESLNSDMEAKTVEAMEERIYQGWETFFELKKENLFK